MHIHAGTHHIIIKVQKTKDKKKSSWGGSKRHCLQKNYRLSRKIKCNIVGKSSSGCSIMVWRETGLKMIDLNQDRDGLVGSVLSSLLCNRKFMTHLNFTTL